VYEQIEKTRLKEHREICESTTCKKTARRWD